MPVPNEPDPAVIAAGLSAVATEGASAVTAITDYNNAPLPKDSSSVCAALADLRGQIESLLAAVIATQVDVGCVIV